MNIKNLTVERLARELAEATGETMTSAIQHALEERLERLRRDRDVDAKLRRVQAILDRMGPVPKGATSDHSDLYDEWGLPK
ncbi:MAG: type II toxin-antitoxin system VapB family antitoxin [Pararhizobium sp.]